MTSVEDDVERLRDDLDRVERDGSEQKQNLAVHEAVCAQRYERIDGQLSNIAKQMKGLIYAVLAIGALQLGSSGVTDVFHAVLPVFQVAHR